MLMYSLRGVIGGQVDNVSRSKEQLFINVIIFMCFYTIRLIRVSTCNHNFWYTKVYKLQKMWYRKKTVKNRLPPQKNCMK